MIKVPIFYYHSIGNTGPETLPVDVFRDHVTLIRELGFTTLTFSELLSLSPSNKKKFVLLTFDDGLLDNFDIATPILEEFGCKATFFVIPGFDNITRWVNPATRGWSDYKRKGFTIPFPSMKVNHRRQLSQSGMEIGCHTLTHPKLTKIPPAALASEIVDSKVLLEDQLGDPVVSFCYPKGRYNRKIIDCVMNAGYLGACTTMPGYYTANSPKFECGRFLVEDRRLFEKILLWSSNNHNWSQPACSAIRPLLKLKNKYF